MSYIGNTATTQSYVPAVDYFSGNASTTAFTLSRPVASVAQVQAVIENVPQNPGSAFTVSGNTITFTSAPPSGTSNIYVYYTSPITQVIQPSQGTVNSSQLDVFGGSGTGGMQLPSGTTAQRPAATSSGVMRYNTTESKYEVYDGSTWVYVNTTVYSYTVEYIVVAGGGGGSSGGGGAGGYLTSSVSVTPGTGYTVTIGGGGTGGSGGSPTNGNNSVFSSYTATGGGYGGRQSVSSSSGSGGSGGGAGRNATGAGSGTSGQGYAGGNGSTSGTLDAGGGGGANAVGNAATSSAAGGGGVGKTDTWTGSTRYLAGGGGGSNEGGGTAAAGGTGGGGAGSATTGTAGTANTGGGGGGGANLGTYGNGGAGGSGIVVIRYSGSQRGTGGTVTSSGGYTIHTFTTSGTYTA